MRATINRSFVIILALILALSCVISCADKAPDELMLPQESTRTWSDRREDYYRHLSEVYDETTRTLTITNNYDWDVWMDYKTGAVRSAILEEGVTLIPDNAFFGCHSLEDISLPYTLERIGILAFAECKQINDVHIGPLVEYIGGGAFTLYDHNIPISLSKDNNYFTILDGILYTKDYRRVVSCNPTVKEVALHENVEYIENWALSARGIKTITLPEGLLVIGEYALYGSEEITELHLPDSLRLLKGGALDGLYGVREIRIPSSTRIATNETGDAVLPHHLERCIIEGDDYPIVDTLFRMDSLKEIVFTGTQPYLTSSYCLSWLSDFKNDNKTTATIYYLNKHKASWSPNGETEWNGIPIIGIDSLNDLPPLE